MERQAELEARLIQEASTREVLQRKLADAEKARQEAQQRHAQELKAAAVDLGRRQVQFDAGLAAAEAARDALEQKLAESHAALERSEEHRESDAALAADDLARRKAEYAPPRRVTRSPIRSPLS